ncbi:hypothetical protein NDU88_001237 [Pleurodeles waltl]|uniref:Uncharacterized protein n=1 Tax=Pleurodeles waltl TaxID=8319 RepID=A0AAV7LGX7_PLEWA|nr:hypothetical protein NDU88_001237 [Pleurodeles waltl]
MDVAGPTDLSVHEAAAHYCTVDVSANRNIDLTSDEVVCILSAIPFDGVDDQGGRPTRHPDETQITAVVVEVGLLRDDLRKLADRIKETEDIEDDAVTGEGHYTERFGYGE